jgi:hypothetical protein
MAVIHDLITDLENIHPENKRVPGERLALLAAAIVYGDKGVVGSGPLFKSAHQEGSRIRIRFSSTGSGLTTRNGATPDGFEIAGDDRKFLPADVSLEPDCALVSSNQISKPLAVRFAWHETAQPNLMNKEGLPAAPFRTDSWLMDDPRTSDHPTANQDAVPSSKPEPLFERVPTSLPATKPGSTAERCSFRPGASHARYRDYPARGVHFSLRLRHRKTPAIKPSARVPLPQHPVNFQVFSIKGALPAVITNS